MPEITIPFRQWLPDQPDHNNPGLVEAKNVYKIRNAFQPVGELQTNRDLSAEIGDVSTIIGAYRAGFTYIAWAEGAYKIKYANSTGTVTISGSWTNDAATNASTALGLHFSAAAFDEAEYFATGLFGLYTTAGGNSATPVVAVSGAPSPFNNVAAVGDFLCGSNGKTFFWSAFNDPTSWTASELTMAGESTVNREDLGDITGIVGGPAPLILQERGVSRLTFVGGAKVWDVRVISDGIGCSAENGWIQVEGVTYFWSGAALYATRGGTLTNLSEGRIEEWGYTIENGLARNTTAFYNVTYKPVFVERQNTILFPPSLFYQNNNLINGGTDSNYWVVYNVEENEFTYFEQGLAVPVPGDFTPIVVRYFIYKDGANGWAEGFQNSTAPLEATMTTGHLSSAGERTEIDGVEPIYEGSGATIALSAKERIRDATSLSAYQSEETSTGVVEIRSNGRSTATSVKFPAASSWSNFSGCVVNLLRAGQH